MKNLRHLPVVRFASKKNEEEIFSISYTNSTASHGWIIWNQSCHILLFRLNV